MSRDTLFKTAPRAFVCGTRAVERWAGGEYRVVCATCRAGGSVAHDLLMTASRAAVRDSNKHCKACGAR